MLDINQAQRVYSTEGTSITIKGLGGGQGAKTGLYAIGVQGDLDKRKTYLKNEIGTLSANPTSDNIPRIIKTMEKQPIYDEEGNRTPEAHRIYDINGISPCFKNAVAIDVYNKSLREECPTLSDPCHNSIRMFDGMQIRRLTPIECERLQGFPDEWTEGVSDTQRYKQCGNAVTTKVIKSIVEQLIVGKFTQNSTSSGFPTENSPNMRYQETSEEVSQIANATSDNANIMRNFCLRKNSNPRGSQITLQPRVEINKQNGGIPKWRQVHKSEHF